MEYSQREKKKRKFIQLMADTKAMLRGEPSNNPTIERIDACIRDVCSCIEEQDYLIPDETLTKIHRVCLCNDMDTQVYDKSGKTVDDAIMFIRQHYNTKMMLKVLTCAKEIAITVFDKHGDGSMIFIDKQSAIRLMKL